MADIRHWLPEGWTWEVRPHMTNIVHIDRPRDTTGFAGTVSVNFNNRVFETGYTVPRVFPRHWLEDNAPVYRGRGWQERLVRDACAWLDKVMAS